MELTFMDLLTLHVNYVLSSLLIVLVFGAVLFGVAYIFAVIELAQERRARRRKEAHNA